MLRLTFYPELSVDQLSNNPALGPVSRNPLKLFGLSKPFLVHLYTPETSCMKRTSLSIKNMWKNSSVIARFEILLWLERPHRFPGFRETDPWGPFLDAPGNYRARYAVLFSILGGSFKSFENGTVKLSAKEIKWNLLEVRRHPNFLKTYIWKYDFGPVKLPGLSRNRPQGQVLWKVDNAIHRINHSPADSVVCFVYTYHWIAIYPLDSVI